MAVTVLAETPASIPSLPERALTAVPGASIITQMTDTPLFAVGHAQPADDVAAVLVQAGVDLRYRRLVGDDDGHDGDSVFHRFSLLSVEKRGNMRSACPPSAACSLSSMPFHSGRTLMRQNTI